MLGLFWWLSSGRNSEHLPNYKELLFSFVPCLSSPTHQASLPLLQCDFTILWMRIRFLPLFSGGALQGWAQVEKKVFLLIQYDKVVYFFKLSTVRKATPDSFTRIKWAVKIFCFLLLNLCSSIVFVHLMF